jgi:hypothetical protein
MGMCADKPVKDPTARDDFQKVIRHFVTTPHKPHSSLGTTPQKKRGGKATPKARKGSEASQVTDDVESE